MTIDMDWFQRQIQAFVQQESLYKEYKQILEQILGHAVRQVCPNAVVQTRVKTVQSFAEKALRKREQHTDPVHQFTDLCGGRIIARLQAEVDAVAAFLRDHFTIDEANSGDTFMRLRGHEFGYRSLHYIVQLKRNPFPNKQVPVRIPDELYPLKAEIQVRTLLQHAWADVDHDRLYRSSFKVPVPLVREWARLAAAMESADEAFGRFAAALDGYKADYGGYADPAAVRQEVEIRQVVRKTAIKDERLAHQAARLLICLEDWDAVIALLDDLPAPQDAGLLCCIGHALCERYKSDRGNHNYQRGRDFLQQATKAESHRVEACIRLAETWIHEGKQKRVLDYYSRAFDIDPGDPQALCGYVRYKIATENNLSFLPLLKPTIAAAVEKCRAHVEAGVNLPWALYHIGELSVLLGSEQAMGSLNAYLRAIQGSTSRHMLEQALEGLTLFEPIEHQLAAVGLGRRLLALALAVKYGREDPDLLRKLGEFALSSARHRDPVAIVAGGCDPAFERQMEGFRPIFFAAFERFQGTVISGGTRQGVSGWVGELGEKYGERITTTTYLPEFLPTDGTATLDERYRQRLCTRGGKGFTALEPLQCWIDLIASGMAPERVRILGINGGNIAAFEYRLGLLLGARVGLVRGSGRKANVLAAEAEMDPIPGLALLPADAMTLEAFLTMNAASDLSHEQRLLMARRIHEDYWDKNQLRVLPVPPALKPWDDLEQAHQEENLHQADDYQRKLAAIGKRAAPVQDREIRCVEFTDEEVLFLAEMEHGRYVAHKLLSGWSLGPKDDVKKQRPTLVGWNELPQSEKEKDIEAMKNLPRLLKELGFEIVEV